MWILLLMLVLLAPFSLGGETKPLTVSIQSAYRSLTAYGDDGSLSFRLVGPQDELKLGTLDVPLYWVREPSLFAVSFGSTEYVRTTISFFEVDHRSKLVREGNLTTGPVGIRWQKTLAVPDDLNPATDSAIASLMIGIILELQSGNDEGILKFVNVEPLASTEAKAAGVLLLKSKDGSFEARTFVDDRNLIERMVLTISPEALAIAEHKVPATSIDVTWYPGTISTDREKVYAKLQSRLVALDKQVDKYDRVALSPAGQPTANFIQCETTLKDRVQSLIRWLRGR